MGGSDVFPYFKTLLVSITNDWRAEKPKVSNGVYSTLIKSIGKLSSINYCKYLAHQHQDKMDKAITLFQHFVTQSVSILCMLQNLSG